MADIAPANRRRGRPLGSKTKFHHQAAAAGSLSQQRQQASLSKPQSQISFIGGDSLVDDLPEPDVAPASAPQADTAFSGYSGKFGTIKTNIVTSYAFIGMNLGGPATPDGMLFLKSAEPIADAWIAWGRTDPRYMRIVKVLWGGPFTTLIIGHAGLIGGLANNHGVNLGKYLMPSSLVAALKKRGGGSASELGQSFPSVARTPSQASEPPTASLPYMPLGAQAPTGEETFGPPPAPDNPDELRVWPDDGLPSDLDVAAREIARRSGRPYVEILNEMRHEWANLQQAHNFKQRPPTGPGQGLGAPVVKE